MHVSTHTPALPQEMLDHIVDYLEKDKPSLLSCTLATRRLLVSSQRHLFRVLRLSRKENVEYGDWKPFFLEHPHLTSYVRTIIVIGTPDTKTRYDCFDNPAGPFCACVLSDILPHFPRVEVVAIDGVSLECVSSCETTLNPLFSPIKGLVCLDLTDVYQTKVEGIPQFIRLLKLFSEIPVIHIVDLSLGCDSDESVETTVMREVAKLPSDWKPQIEELIISVGDVGRFDFLARLLTAVGCLTNLQQLEIVFRSWGDYGPTVSLIKASEKTLVRLCLDLAHTIDDHVDAGEEEELILNPIDPIRWKGFGLASCLSLAYFEVSVILRELPEAEFFPNIQPNVRAFQYMLDQISDGPRNIKTLSIFIRLVDDTYVDIISQNYDWDRLATLIYCPNTFPNLQTVDLVLLAEDDDFRDAANECFKIVCKALRPKKASKRKHIFHISCQQGDYDELVRAS